MANIPFTHQTISNGVTQASAGTMQTVFDAIRMIVDKSGYRSTYVLDADTVSGYGIGVNPTKGALNCDNLSTNGMYAVQGNGSNEPWHGFYNANIVTIGNSLGDLTQLGFLAGQTQSGFKIRSKVNGGSWTAWQHIFISSGTAGSGDIAFDGNGGQPPAPKPADASGTYTVGSIKNTTYSAGATKYASGYTDGTKSGTYWTFVVEIGTTPSFGCAVGSGGSLGTVPAGTTAYVSALRIA